MGYRIFLAVALFVFVGGCENQDLFNNANQNVKSSQPFDASKLAGEAIDVVKAGLRDENGMVKTNAIEVVASTKQKQLMDEVLDQLDDERVPVRFSALLAVGDLEYKTAKRRIEPMFSDENENVKMAVAYAMQKLGDGKYQELYARWLKSSNQTVRANAALLLGKLGSSQAIPMLKAMLVDTQSSDQARYQAVEAMAMLHDEKAYPKIWTMLISAFADVRVMGIRSMGALGTQKARDAMVTLLDDDVLEVRLAAAEQLAALGENTGAIVVKEYLEGRGDGADASNDRAKMLAALAIGQIGTAEVTTYLPGLLRSQSPMVRLAAAKSVLLLNQKQTANLQ